MPIIRRLVGYDMKKPNALYYICHSDNLESILSDGIFSREEIEKEGVKHQDIHVDEVLDRRNRLLLTGENLQSYVNLYFQPRNAMLYRLRCNGLTEKLVILAIKPSILDREGVLVSDRNAASVWAEITPVANGLVKIDKKILDLEYWTDGYDTKQKMMAEVLVPKKINPDEIMTIYAPKRGCVSKNDGGMSVAVEPRMFFRPTLNKTLNAYISLHRGDMFFSAMQTFTISVNTKGIMGKGLASRTKYQFPDAYVRYQDDCKYGKLRIGTPTLYKRGIRIEKELADDVSQLKEENLNDPRWFLFLATKGDWRENSQLESIERSMQWLVEHYEQEGIQSIAMPALGCGLGNLHWRDAGPMMCRYLQQMKIQSCIYLPMGEQIDEKYLLPDYLLS